MPEETLTCWLQGPDGLRLRVDAGGLLLGRSATCDLVLPDTRASSRHAFVRVGPTGPEIVPLGRNPTFVNKERVEGAAPLTHGDRVDLPGVRLNVHVQGEPGRDRGAWVIERAGSGSYGIHRTPYRVGGGERDHLQVLGWPEEAVILHAIQGSLVLELSVLAALDGEEHGPGELLPACNGARLEIAGEILLFLHVSASSDSVTSMPSEDPLPDLVILEDLPEGADLRLTVERSTTSVRLAPAEARLVRALLFPTAGLEVGDFVPDEDLVGLVWPGRLDRGPSDVAPLVRSAQGQLLATGLNPLRLLERARSGAATRFRVGPATRLELR